MQVFSNVNGLPLDDDGSGRCSRPPTGCAVPIFLHPARGAGFADYPGEAKSKYEIWWTFGWPYETSAAMQRLVFSRLFDRLPDIKIVAHHLGAMVPYFEGRVGYGLDQFGARTADEDYEALRRSMPKRPYDYFKMFWADTAVFGSRAATECGLKFFGPDQVMFASDAPFDPEGGLAVHPRNHPGHRQARDHRIRARPHLPRQRRAALRTHVLIQTSLALSASFVQGGFAAHVRSESPTGEVCLADLPTRWNSAASSTSSAATPAPIATTSASLVTWSDGSTGITPVRSV